jgi:hypothetical protein
MELWRAVDAHDGGVEAQIKNHGGFVDLWSQICIDLMRRRIWIRISIKVMSRIQSAEK